VRNALPAAHTATPEFRAQDASGNTSVWLINGSNVTSPGSLGQIPGWSIVGQRDFTGDGDVNLLRRDGNGDTALFLMNGTMIASDLSQWRRLHRSAVAGCKSSRCGS
jgi:hypothetical protein